MPDFDFDAFNHDENPDEVVSESGEASPPVQPATVEQPQPTEVSETAPQDDAEEVDKW